MADPVVTGASLGTDGNTITVEKTVPEEATTDTLSLASLKNEVDQTMASISKSQTRLDFIQAIFGFLGITYP